MMPYFSSIFSASILLLAAPIMISSSIQNAHHNDKYGNLTLDVYLNLLASSARGSTLLESGAIKMNNSLFKMFIHHREQAHLVKPFVGIFLGLSRLDSKSMNECVNITAWIEHPEGRLKGNFKKNLVDKFSSALTKKDADGRNYYIFGWEQFENIELLTNIHNYMEATRFLLNFELQNCK